ncbi:hypothetical protein CLU79DRAFT_725870 [Phycomyces nitens]|nr:hypothetical protein CLU79DRAFT_725870 [Phycomyces nitens]
MLQGTDDPPLFTNETRHILSEPLDPRIEREYNKLVDTWTQQLLTDGHHLDILSSDTQSIRLSCMRLMHRYLDQQWIDSQQMLQCAQAWNSYPSLSPVEAVHTMNILSLRTMQRSIDARREFLHALGDSSDQRPMIDLSLPLPTPPSFSEAIPNPIPEPEPDSLDRNSFALSEEEVHAPLLRTHKLSYPQLPEPQLVFHPPPHRYRRDSVWTHPHGDPIQPEEKTEVEPFSPRESDESTSEPMYQRLSTWKKLVGDRQATGLDPEDPDPWQSLYGPGFLSSSSSSSFFPKEDLKEPLVTLTDPEDVVVKTSPQPLKSALRAHHNIHSPPTPCPSSPPPPTPTLSSPILRSESSISAFRPISKNLAPRCKAPTCSVRHSHSSLSIRSYANEGSCPDSSVWKVRQEKPTITKSCSVPTTVGRSISSKTSPPLPTSSTSTKIAKERNFVMRSIVSKKASLGKLFAGKKASN